MARPQPTDQKYVHGDTLHSQIFTVNCDKVSRIGGCAATAQTLLSTIATIVTPFTRNESNRSDTQVTEVSFNVPESVFCLWKKLLHRQTINKNRCKRQMIGATLTLRCPNYGRKFIKFEKICVRENHGLLAGHGREQYRKVQEYVFRCRIARYLCTPNFQILFQIYCNFPP